MSGGQFNFSMVFKAEGIAAAKSGVSEFTGTVDALSAASAKAGATARQQATDLDSLTQAAAKAVGAQDQLVAAEKRASEARARAMVAPLANPAGSVAPLQAAYKATETSVGSLQKTMTGFTATLGSQGQEMLEQAAATRVYQSALDDVRASFNPLFAASRQYEQQLERIAEAEKIGAINAREAAAARTAAADRLTPATPGQQRPGGASSAYSANIGAQGFDIGVTAAMGMSPAMIGLQQGSQLAGIAQQMGGGATAAKSMAAGIMSIINPTSLVIIGLTTLAAVGIQGLMSLVGQSKTLEERIDDLTDAFDRYKSTADLAGASSVDMVRQFGTGAGAAQNLYAVLSNLNRLSVDQKLKSTSTAVRETLGILTRDLRSGNTSRITDFFDLPRAFGQANPNFASSRALEKSVQNFEGAKGIDAQTAAMQTLLEQVAHLATMKGGISDEEQKLIDTLKEQADVLLGIQAIETARKEAIKRQVDQMVLGYRQEADLLGATAQFGAESLQVEKLKGEQAVENLNVRLEEMGVQKDSAQWQDAHNALTKQQAELLKAVIEAGRERIRDQQDALAATQRETSLIGASNSEKQRANALAAAEIEIRKRKLVGLDAEVERFKAIQKAEADAEREKRQALYNTSVSSVLDGYDNQIADERDPARRAAIEGEREYIRLILQGVDAVAAAAEGERVRAKALAEVTREQKKAMEGVAARAAGDAFDARIAGELNPYIRAQIEGEKEYAAQIAANSGEQVAAAEAARVRARALSELGQAQADYLRGQAESLQQSQLELGLIGQTEAVRTRVLALAQAEREIARLGLTGDQAELVRRNTVAQVEMSREIEAQADAWKRVQSAGESAIDGVLDKLRGGDIGGAFEDLIGEIEKGFFDLAVRNPLKNALFGTNLGTLGDVGGLKGIWAQLSGKRPVDEAALVSQATSSVQTMNVTAMNLTISGAGAASFLSDVGGNPLAANSAGAPVGAFGGLSGSGDVQSQVWSYFTAKGLQPHQIAAIMGNISGESGFNPLAVGDGGTSFGLFQHHAGRGQGLLNAVGGKSGLGNVSGQLDYMWSEMLGSESGVLKRLLASTNVREATGAFVGYERPQGWSANNPEGAHNFGGRLGAAEAALTKFQNTTTTTAQGLGTLGTGFDVFGSALSQGLSGLASGGGQGGLSGLLSGLASGIASSLGIPGFSDGGDFWGGLRIVGENGRELEATGASRIWTASQTRDILTSRSMPGVANSNASIVQLQPILVNTSSSKLAMETEETTDSRGQRQQKYILSDAVGEGMATPGGKGARAMKQTYGVTRVGRKRS